MRFRQSLIHRREIRVAEAERGERALVIACPRCRMEFFTTVVPLEPGHTESQVRAYPDVRALLLRARVLLQQECPDHPHEFEAAPREM